MAPFQLSTLFSTCAILDARRGNDFRAGRRHVAVDELAVLVDAGDEELWLHPGVIALRDAHEVHAARIAVDEYLLTVLHLCENFPVRSVPGRGFARRGAASSTRAEVLKSSTPPSAMSARS